MIASIPQKHRKSANVLTVFHTCAMLSRELNMPYQEWLRTGPVKPGNLRVRKVPIPAAIAER